MLCLLNNGDYFNIFALKIVLIGFVAKCTKFYGETQRARNKYWLFIGSIYPRNSYKCTVQTYFESYWMDCIDLTAFGGIQCTPEGEQRQMYEERVCHQTYCIQTPILLVCKRQLRTSHQTWVVISEFPVHARFTVHSWIDEH